MFNDLIIRTPINGTAAKVVSQKGCVDELTPQQERDSVLDHIRQVEDQIDKRKKGEARTDEHKALGLKKASLCERLSELNEKLKRFGFGDENRIDHIDCVYSVLKEQLTAYQYKRIMALAMELYQSDLATKAKVRN